MVSKTDTERLEALGLDPDRIPTHVAIIMDGNGRWAQQRNLPRLAGHRAGTENLRTILRACVEFRVEILTLYAFSTENWGRPEDEVKGLLRILEDVIDRELAELHQEGVRLQHIGDLSRISTGLRKKVLDAIEMTKNNRQLTLNVAFNYGGRAEIVHAVQEIVKAGYAPEEINEELISLYLYTGSLPDPDLIIRTSGELRTSNFLLWQNAYAEWYFPTVFWPDFGREELKKALQHYADRDRRYGKVKK